MDDIAPGEDDVMAAWISDAGRDPLDPDAVDQALARIAGLVDRMATTLPRAGGSAAAWEAAARSVSPRAALHTALQWVAIVRADGQLAEAAIRHAMRTGDDSLRIGLDR
jgi:hypothetical protein